MNHYRVHFADGRYVSCFEKNVKSAVNGAQRALRALSAFKRGNGKVKKVEREAPKGSCNFKTIKGA